MSVERLTAATENERIFFGNHLGASVDPENNGNDLALGGSRVNVHVNKGDEEANQNGTSVHERDIKNRRRVHTLQFI